MWEFLLIVAGFFLAFTQEASCLRMIQVEVPDHIVAGHSVKLRCIYDMEGDELYSVKWYKSGAEFYRYLPKDQPPAQVYEVPGVTVDLNSSGGDVITLPEVNLHSSGIYRCEVSAEAPSFVTVNGEGEMNVIALPQSGPKITGLQPKYDIGDTVKLNCTSFNSKPAAMLTWTINSHMAPKNHLLEYQTELGRRGLETSILGLQFRVSHTHYKDGEMKLKCAATIAPIYHQSSEETIIAVHQPAPVFEHSPEAAPVQDNVNQGCYSKCLSASCWIIPIAQILWTFHHG